MARVTQSRTAARSGKSATTPKKGAAKKPTRGTAKPAKTTAPKRVARTPRVVAKPARAATTREQISGRVDKLERNIASLRSRHSELKRALADVIARIDEPPAAPARPVRRGRKTEAPGETAGRVVKCVEILGGVISG